MSITSHFLPRRAGRRKIDQINKWLRKIFRCRTNAPRLRGAPKVGPDQSFLGIATRITRTDYVVSFLIRDARTGAIILRQSSDLRIGADYSWFRGARTLIRDHLLDGS